VNAKWMKPSHRNKNRKWCKTLWWWSSRYMWWQRCNCRRLPSTSKHVINVVLQIPLHNTRKA